MSSEKISCSTCLRRSCRLRQKTIRRFLVGLLGCNYWAGQSSLIECPRCQTRLTVMGEIVE